MTFSYQSFKIGLEMGSIGGTVLSIVCFGISMLLHSLISKKKEPSR
jgi:hypothetical protein